VIPLPTGRQAITPLDGAFGERTLPLLGMEKIKHEKKIQ
jgi:hypothetical protein